MPLDTLKKIETEWGISLCSCKKSPIDIPNVGRNDLAELFEELGFNRGVEVGTEEGVYAEILCKANSSLHLTCVDPWEAYKGYREHVTQPVMDALFDITKARLKDFNVDYLRKYSSYALNDIPNGSLDFVYIDANHDLLNAVTDIVGWSEKVRSGGIVSGHDFIKRGPNEPVKCHVVQAVQAYTDAYYIRPYMILGNREKVPGIVRDKPRSWMWVKP